jgi:5'-methylthioadenosine phosphorylase
MVTDYDCWHETEEAVSGEAVMEVIGQNVKMSQEVVRQMVGRLGQPHGRGCICAEALKYSLITERSLIPAETLKALAPIVGKYIKSE